MYGLLIQCVYEYLREAVGEHRLDEIRKRASVKHHAFVTHKIYSETVLPRIANSSAEVLGQAAAEIYEGFGTSFVNLMQRYGYDRILRVLGRNFSDFVDGLDNLHEYLRFSYPKLKSPSFYVGNQDKHGLELHYITKRKGYTHYVMGQLRQVGRQFFNIDVDVKVTEENISKDVNEVTFRVNFKNMSYKNLHASLGKTKDFHTTSVKSAFFFDLFPFHVVFDYKDMIIRSVGKSLADIMDEPAVHQNVDEIFSIIRPPIELQAQQLFSHLNSTFELITLQPVGRETAGEGEDNASLGGGLSESERNSLSGKSFNTSITSGSSAGTSNCLKLRGQIRYMDDWESFMFLGSPIIGDIDDMFNYGMYLNDLSMHDLNRDLILANTQQSSQLKILLDQEKLKSKKFEENTKKIEIERKRAEKVLLQLLPKSVAKRLQNNEPAMSTCESFEKVSLLFTDVVGFTTICSTIQPMEVVAMLNQMYTWFDNLIEKHKVYKVATIGDAYMVVSGAPTVTKFHAHFICDMALEIVATLHELEIPNARSNKKEHLNLRLGIHSGPVVGGVVGTKCPRYWLFGDTVTIANTMEASGAKNKVHISETTRQELIHAPYDMTVRPKGDIDDKYKSQIPLQTYWLLRQNLNRGDEASQKEKLRDLARIEQAEVDRTADPGIGVGAAPYRPVTPEEARAASRTGLNPSTL